jgi:UDP-2,3-diacylglucosamine pyrophosphatase LpxH
MSDRILLEQELKEFFAFSATPRNRPTPKKIHQPIKCEAVFISDLHLDHISSKAWQVWNFLRHVDPKEIYVVGDVASLYKNIEDHSHEAHTVNILSPDTYKNLRAVPEIARHLIEEHGAGKKITYITGNHDPLVPLGAERISLTENLVIARECDFSVGNRKFLVTHGDRFDPMHRAIAAKEDYSYWRNAGARTKDFFNNLGDFFQSQSGYAGIICGHTHSPTCQRKYVTEETNYHYKNLGSWVRLSNLTALMQIHRHEVPRLVRWDKDQGILAYKSKQSLGAPYPN